MSLERFGFAIGASSACAPSASKSTNAANTHTVDDPVAPSTKKRRFNSAWKEGHDWLELDGEEGVMFCAWCHSFARSDIRNQFISGPSSMKLESTSSPHATRTLLEIIVHR